MCDKEIGQKNFFGMSSRFLEGFKEDANGFIAPVKSFAGLNWRMIFSNER